MKGQIYEIFNTLNNKRYIGQTSSIKTLYRINEHIKLANQSEYKYSQTKLCRAIRKYGWNSFTWQDLEVIECETKEELNIKLHEREIYYQEHFNTIDDGYNIVKGSPLFPNCNIGKLNHRWIKIDIDFNEYCEAAKEGLTRKELAERFNETELHIRMWKQRMIKEDIKNKDIFIELDKIRMRKSLDKLYLVNKLDNVNEIIRMRKEGKTMKAISNQLNISFHTVRTISDNMKRGLIIC